MIRDIIHRHSEILSSWKEIAAFLGKGVRTVQRWERTLGLPIMRPGGSSIILARRRELEEWLSRAAPISCPAQPPERHTAVKATLAERLCELKRKIRETRLLRDQIHHNHRTLRQQIETLRFHAKQWSSMKSQCAADLTDGERHDEDKDIDPEPCLTVSAADSEAPVN